MANHAYRSSLPITEPQRPAATPMDIREAGAPVPLRRVTAPEGAPNVLMILLDDMGYGASSAFGGPCRMPTAERLAAGGLRFSRFHTTAICSPTRASLLTGRNHHTVGMGGITEVSTSQPGYDAVRPDSCAPLAEILRLNGYNTGAFGKWHQTPTWETSRSGPFDHWPTGEGFERFYGFSGGETDQWQPTLFEGNKAIRTPGREGYHLSEDLADRLIADIREQQAMTPGKPFFHYLSFGAVHAPHQAPKEYIDAYRGQFDDGWDAQRERTLARQKKLGLVPRDAMLSPRPASIRAWDGLDDAAKRLYARMMEAYAGMATHTDDQVGRVVDALDEMGLLDNTIVYYILGDNGASAEAGEHGCLNEYAAYNLHQESVESMLERIDEIGGPTVFNHYPVGWAHAMNTPFQWTKQIASHWGGTRNGMIAHWPDGIAEQGGIRDQFTHVNDVAPTILEIAGLPEPSSVNGVTQKPMEGVSMAYTFDAADAPEQHTTQYFEIFGNRGIYHHGWSACTMHGVPWELAGAPVPFTEDVWELYAPDDFSQSRNLAAENPEKLRELQDLFLIEGAKYQVFPLDDRKVVRVDPDLVGRPRIGDPRKVTLYPGMRHLSENTLPDTKNRSWRVTADIEITDGPEPARGAVIAQGGRFGGWSLYLHEGAPEFCYSWLDIQRYEITGTTDRLAPGKHTLTYVFTYDGGGMGKGGLGELFVDDKPVGSVRLERTIPFVYHATDWLDVAEDNGAPVTERYGTENGVFTGGRVGKVVLEVGEAQGSDPVGTARAHASVQ
ncbi:arylsulfatase [Streptomyces ipomoeae]|uniref:arylsulfatase n=1 Tax=Streptomyces ipomoeae TaxID=103232 RepID=UPI0011461EF6|nr:arylsulfatase [Streptomyces ipomoeae]MDX2935529.1 arylsulfatase [Streptomyces ipomoeae]TQE18357.1 arylsulfatase [Streptomyces ipomoeae]